MWGKIGSTLVTLALSVVPVLADQIADVVTWPEAPAVIQTGNSVRIDWYYRIDTRSGARMVVHAMRAGREAPGNTSSGFIKARGEGGAHARVTLRQPGDIDALRIRIIGEDRQVRAERTIPLRMRFADDPLGTPPLRILPRTAITLTPDAPARAPQAPTVTALLPKDAVQLMLNRGDHLKLSARIPEVIILPDGEMTQKSTLMGPPPPYESSMNPAQWSAELEHWLGFVVAMMGYDIQRLIGDGEAFADYMQMEEAGNPTLFQRLDVRRRTIGNLLDGL